MKNPRRAILLLSIVAIVLLSLLSWRWTSKLDRVLVDQQALLEEERLVPCDSRLLQSNPDLNPTLLPHAEKIISALYSQGRWFLGTDSGLRLFDPQGNLLHHFSLSEGWPQGEIVSITLHRQKPVILLSGVGLVFPEDGPLAIIPRRPSYRQLTCLLSTSQGDLWIGTRSHGLLRWKEDRLEKVSNGFPAGAHVTQLAGNSLDLWVGTFEQGAWNYNAGRWSSWDSSTGLPDKQITSLAVKTGGDLIALGTPLGGIWLEQEKIRGRFLENEFVSSLGFVQNDLIASLRTGAAFTLTPGVKARNLYAPTEPFPDLPSGGRETRLFPAREQLYAASGNTLWSVNNLSAPQWNKVLSLEDSGKMILSDKHISALAIDGGSRLWIGFFDSGLDILDLTSPSTRHLRNDLLFCINAIAADRRDGRIFVSTANGLAIFSSPETYHPIQREAGLIHNSISTTLPSAQSTDLLYVATAGGLTLLEPDRSRSLYVFHGLPSNQLYSLASTPKGLYVGTLAGLSFLDFKNRPRNFSRSSSPLAHNWVNALCYQDQTLWIGTYGGGIQTLHSDDRWETPCTECNPLRINPGAIFSYRGILLAGSQDDGFFLFDPRRRTYAQVKHSIPSLNITAFAADETHLYVGSDRGLVQFLWSEVHSYLRGNSRSWR